MGVIGKIREYFTVLAILNLIVLVFLFVTIFKKSISYESLIFKICIYVFPVMLATLFLISFITLLTEEKNSRRDFAKIVLVFSLALIMFISIFYGDIVILICALFIPFGLLGAIIITFDKDTSSTIPKIVMYILGAIVYTAIVIASFFVVYFVAVVFREGFRW